MRKDTPKPRKASTKKTDPLKPYRAQAAIIINMMFDDPTTPDFIKDLLDDWITELESTTQVFYNYREIAVVALPLMLKEAAAQGIDAMSQRSAVFLDAIASLHGRADADRDEYREQLRNTPERQLQRELEKDADAIARLINSPHVPTEIKHELASAVLTFMDDFNEHPDVIRTQYPLAMLRHMAEEKGESVELTLGPSRETTVGRRGDQ